MLDYYGFSYDVVEVNSVTKKQLKWSNYKKVPIVVADGAGDSGFLVSLLVHCVCVCECVCVCACTHAGGYGLRAINMYGYVLVLRFYISVFIDFVKHSVLTLVSEIRYYRKTFQMTVIILINCFLSSIENSLLLMV